MAPHLRVNPAANFIETHPTTAGRQVTLRMMSAGLQEAISIMGNSTARVHGSTSIVE